MIKILCLIKAVCDEGWFSSWRTACDSDGVMALPHLVGFWLSGFLNMEVDFSRNGLVGIKLSLSSKLYDSCLAQPGSLNSI